MTKKKITVKKTCPACNGRGKSYGTRRCGRCNGRNTVRETAIIEDIGEKRTAGEGDLNRVIAEELRELLQSDSDA